MKKSTSGKLAVRLASAFSRFIINILFYFAVVFVIVKGADYIYHFSYQVFGSVAKTEKPGKDVTVKIYRGETTMNIATKLETSQVIVDKYSFLVKTKLKEYNIMPGTYVLNTSMDYNDILDVITNASNSIEKEEEIGGGDAAAEGDVSGDGGNPAGGKTSGKEDSDTGRGNVKE